MDFTEVPIGFGMALAQNEKAVSAYAAMTREQKDAVIARAHQAESREEMQRIVADVAEKL